MGPNAKGALLGLLGFGIFSTHDVIVKYLGTTYTPYQIVFFGVLFGFPLVLFLLVGDSEEANMRPRHPWWTALRTASILVSTICVFYAFSVLPLAQTYSILFAMPLIITVLAVPILKERVGLHRGGAVLAGLTGVLVVVRPDSAEFTLGHLAAIVGVFFSALASVIVRRIGRDERNLVLLMIPMLGSFLVTGGLMLPGYQPMPLFDLVASAIMAALGFIALNCMIRAYKMADAVVVAPMQYSQIIWATIFGALLFNEQLELNTIIGTGILIVSGAYIVLRENKTDISDNTPVLSTRIRMVTGTLPDQSGSNEKEAIEEKRDEPI